jgi:hypothetical protein
MKFFALRRNMASLVLVLTFAFLGGIWVVLSRARTSVQQEKALTRWKVKKVGARKLGAKAQDELAPGERVIEDQIPSHLPVKVELKNFEVEPLLRNLEIKVTNTSDKPIYYLKLSILLPNVLSPNGNPMNFPLRYGRTDLIDFNEPVRVEDVPISSGESYIFKIPEENLRPFERLAAKKKLSRSEINIVYLLFHLLNFGDKTGFSTTGGIPIPNLHKGQTSNGACGEGNEGELSKDFTNARPDNFSGVFLAHLTSSGSFVKLGGSKQNSSIQSNLCCPGSSCSYVMPASTTVNAASPKQQLQVVKTLKAHVLR